MLIRHPRKPLIITEFLKLSNLDQVKPSNKAKACQRYFSDMNFSPIRIQYTVYLQELSPFFVHICAIIGGIYAVSSIFESVLRNSLSIFAIGALEDDHNSGVTGKKV